MTETELVAAYGHPPLAERLADEAPLALGTVLYRAHDRALQVERQLELEATDPRVQALFDEQRAVRQRIAALLVEVAAEAVER